MGDPGIPYEFSSPPTVPREKGEDILVKIQAVSSNNPCLFVKTYRLYSKASVRDVRSKVQQDFDQIFRNGFVFLCKNTEVITARKKTLTLSDILPKAGQGRSQNQCFQYSPDVTYKKLPFERDGRRYLVTCIGLLFLCDASGVSHWNLDALRQRLDARGMTGFSFIPSDITSARPDVNDSVIEELNQYASVARTETGLYAACADKENNYYGFYKEKIETLLRGAELSEEKLKDQRLATPLHYAAQGGHLSMCQFLCMRLDKYKLMYEKDINGRTPLHCALYQHGIKSNREHLKVAAYLLSFQPDLDSPDVNGISCYYMILSLKKEDTVYLMKQLDPDIIDQKLVLHFTCCALQYKELKHALMFCEVVPTVEPTFLRPPLHLAAEFGNLKIIQNLLNGGHSVFDRDPDGHLPFHYACQHDRTEFVTLLVDKKMNGADVAKGIRLAFYNRNLEVISKVSDLDLDIDLDPDFCQTLIKETHKNIKTFAKPLLGCLKKCPELLAPFVGQAAYLGLTDLLEWLLSICPPDTRDVMMRAPLHDAVQGAMSCSPEKEQRGKNCLDAFKNLVITTNNLNVVDWRNSTPLHYACMEGNLEFVKFMLSQQDLSFASVRDSMGRTPLLLAAHYKKGRKVLDYMINHHLEHLDPYAMDACGKNILHYVGYMKVGLTDALLRKLKKLPHISPEPYKVQHGFSLKQGDQFSNKTQNEIGYLKEMDDGNWTCRYCEIKIEHNGTHFCQFLFQSLPPCTSPSLLETLIIMNKPEILNRLVKEMPKLLEGDGGVKARFCAVRLWRYKCADVLISKAPDQDQYLDKYLLAALEMKPTDVWCGEEKQKKRSSKCRLSSLKVKADEKEAQNQYLMVEYLMKKGADPYYLPIQGGYKVDPRDKLCFFQRKNSYEVMSPPLKNSDVPLSLRRFCTALERAVIIGNEQLIDLLLKRSNSRIRESFAIHLAAKSGNVTLLQRLLQIFKTEKKFHIATDLSFVSSLPNGILGSACVSENPSFELFETIHQNAPEVFKGTKLVTAKLLVNSRPPMLEILRIHDILPLVLFMQKWQQHLRAEVKEAIVCFILQNGSYPFEVRIKKKSFIHPVCDLFKTAQAKKMWKVLAILLKQSGSTLWKCLLGANDEKMKCHECVYNKFGRVGSILEHALGRYKSSPIEVISMLTQSGLRTITSLDRCVKEQIMETYLSKLLPFNALNSNSSEASDDDGPGNDTGAEKQIQQLFQSWLFPRLWYLPLWKLKRSDRNKSNEYSFQYLEKQVWMPDTVDCDTMNVEQLGQLVGKAPVLHELINVRKTAMFQQKRAKYRALEKKLVNIWLFGIQLGSVLGTVSVSGDVELMEYLLNKGHKVNLKTNDMELHPLDIAALRGDLPMVKLLMQFGAIPTESTFACACLDHRTQLKRSFLWKQNIWMQDDIHVRILNVAEKRRNNMFEVIKFMCESSCEDDSSTMYNTMIQIAAMQHDWTLIDYLLDKGAPILQMPDRWKFTEQQDGSDLSDMSEAVTFACKGLMDIILHGPQDLALKALGRTHNVDWEKHSIHMCMCAAASSGNTHVIGHLCREVLFQTPSLLDTSKDAQDILCKQLKTTPCTTGVLHILCKNGDVENVHLILKYLAKRNVHFLDTLDKTRFTPLWYALAHQHWEMAELLLMNGASPVLHRAVPDLDRKKTCYDLPERKTKVTTKRKFPGILNNSTGVAAALEFKGILSLKQESEPKFRKTSMPFPRIKAPGCDTKEAAKRDDMLKRVQYLMGLARLGKSMEGTIFQGAVIEGDIRLMKEIMTQPMFTNMMEKAPGPSPLLLALVNRNAKAITLCKTSFEIMKDPVTIAERSSQAIISLSQNTDIVLGKLRNLKKTARGTQLGQRVDVLFENIRASYLKGKQLQHFHTAVQCSLQELTKGVLDIVPTAEKIPNILLVAMALLNKSDIFTHLHERVKRSQEDRDILSRSVLMGYTITDILIVFTSQRGNADLYNSLKVLSRIDTLEIRDHILMFLVKMNMRPELRTIAENNLKKAPERMLSRPWLDVFTYAATKGDAQLLKTMLKLFKKRRPKTINDIISRALEASCSKGYIDPVEALLTFAIKSGSGKALDILPALLMAARHGRTTVLKQLLKFCNRTQCFNIDMVTKVLHSTSFSGSLSSFKAIYTLGEDTFRKNKDVIIIAVPTVFMHAIKRGHEQFCLYILENIPSVDLTVTDQMQETSLHFACKWGAKQLVMKMLEKNIELMENEDKDGRKPIHYAQAMGQVGLLMVLSEKYDLRPTLQLSDEILHCGWLRWMDRNIKRTNRKHTDTLHPAMTPANRHGTWTIEYAMSVGNEEAALAMFSAAEGPIAAAVNQTNLTEFLIHIAAKFGCFKMIAVLFKALEREERILRNILLTEFEGHIPLALAVRYKHTECVRLLVQKEDTTNWMSSTTKETVFHIAAISGDVAMLQTLLKMTNPEKIHIRNNHGMEASLYSIALGHHHMSSLFFEMGFPNYRGHLAHKVTDYTCHHCLLDLCIGWSNLYLSRKHISGPRRDVAERRKSAAGYVLMLGKGMTHTLEWLLELVRVSRHTSLVERALTCMGYTGSVDVARLFLLQSKGLSNFSNISICLSKGWQRTAIDILHATGKTETEDFYCKVLEMTITNHCVEVFQHLIKTQPQLLNRPLVDFTPFEIAISLQRYDICEEIVLNTQSSDVNQRVSENLKDIKESIPLVVRWMTEISHPGDKGWAQSIETARLADANCLMLHRQNSNLIAKIHATSSLDSIFPDNVLNKTLLVDMDSFKRGTHVSDVSDAWLMAMVASHLQTLTSVLQEAHRMEIVDIVEVSCLPSSSVAPFMELSGRRLRDRVKLETIGSSASEPIHYINASERLPNKLHEDAYLKKLVETEVIPIAEELAGKVAGHKVKVKVDWSSFNSEHSDETRTTVYRLLAGKDLKPELGGLIDILQRCKYLCDDVHDLCGNATMTSIQDLLLPLKEIVVKQSSSFTAAHHIMVCLSDQSIPWSVSCKGGRLSITSYAFPLYSIIRACHSVCVNISSGLCELKSEVENRSQSECTIEQKRLSRKAHPELEVYIDWTSFGCVGDTDALSTLGRNSMRLEMHRLAAGLKNLLWYKVEPKQLILRNVALASETSLSIENDSIILAMHASHSNISWMTRGLDIYTQFQEIEVRHILEMGIEAEPDFRHDEVCLQISGLKLCLSMERVKWLEYFARHASRQMVSPLNLLKTCVSHFKDIERMLTHEIEQALILCSGVWPVERMQSDLKITSGMWCWVTTAELGNGISHDTFLVRFRGTAKRKDVFSIMSKRNAQALKQPDVGGVWYYQPFDMKSDLKTIRRLQLISFENKLYHITDPFTIQSLLLNIPSQIKMGSPNIGYGNKDEKTLLLPFEPWPAHLIMYRHLKQSPDRVYVDSEALHDCWKKGLEMGINVVIDTEDLRRYGAYVVEQIAVGVARSLELFTQQNDGLTQHLFRNSLSSQGVLLVGCADVMKDERAPWIAEGTSYDDMYFSISPLSENDIFVSCERALEVLKENVEKEDRNKVDVYTRFPKVLTLAFGYKFVQTSCRRLSYMLHDLCDRRGALVTVSFLEPTPEETFLPKSKKVFETITEVFKLANTVYELKELFTKGLRKVQFEETYNDESSVVKYDNEVLTVLGANKGIPIAAQDIIKALFTRFGVTENSLNTDADGFSKPDVHDSLWKHIRSNLHGRRFSSDGEEEQLQQRSNEQMVLIRKDNPIFFLYPHHEDACLTSPAFPQDNHLKHGKCVEHVDFSGFTFEVTYTPQFGTKEMKAKWYTMNYESATESLFSFKMVHPRPKVFIRARCRQCKAFIELYTKYGKANSGEHLEVVFAPDVNM